MSTTLEFPIPLKRMSPEDQSWLVAKSSQTGKSVDEIACELIRKAAEKDGFKTVKPETGEAQ
jgi:hypothetical protein